jgi:hypothetical protein
MERIAEIAQELTILNHLPAGAAAILDRELERIIAFHTEKCCDTRLSPEQSAHHREARAVGRGLLGFFEKRKAALNEEARKLRQQT